MTTDAMFHEMTDKQVFDLLGEILDPSIYTPFNVSDELMDALMPISKAYRDEYDRVNRIMDEQPGWTAYNERLIRGDPLHVPLVKVKIAQLTCEESKR